MNVRPTAESARGTNGAGYGRFTFSFLIGIYSFAIAALGANGYLPAIPSTSIWDVQDTRYLIHWLSSVALVIVTYFLVFVPVGFGAAYVVDWVRRRDTRNRQSSLRYVEFRGGDRHQLATAKKRYSLVNCGCFLLVASATLLLRILVALAAAGFVLYLIRGAEITQSVVLLVAASIGCFTGVWLGSLWRWGRWGRVALALQFAFAGVLVIVFWIWSQSRLITDEPFSFHVPQVTSAAKRELVERVRGLQKASPDRRYVFLNEDDANLLMAWGLSLGSSGRKARVDFGDEQSAIQASLRLPGKHQRYVNLEALGQLSADSTGISVRIDKVVLGGSEIPASLVQTLAQFGLFLIHQDADLRAAVNRLDRLRIDSEGIEVVGLRREHSTSDSNEKGVVANLLAKMGDKPEVVEAVRAQLKNLLQKSHNMPSDKNDWFEFYLSSAFEFARARSENGDPALENRGAVLALGILLGHREIERFIGNVTDSTSRVEMRNIIGKVTIDGRADWTRHFAVSAALAALSSDFISDAAGLLKEELDAERGTGFSFSDLAADRAGTLFALAATKNSRAARRIQKELVEDFELRALFPVAHDLPEGLSDAELQSNFGGVGGERYIEVEREIERRLRECRILHDN